MPRTANKQQKLHVRKGDRVRILSGNDKGKEGKILRVYRQKGRVIVEGVNISIRHTKPNQLYPQGGRIEQEASVHISNVSVLDGNGDPTRIGRKRIQDSSTGKGHWARIAVTTGEEIDH